MTEFILARINTSTAASRDCPFGTASSDITWVIQSRSSHTHLAAARRHSSAQRAYERVPVLRLWHSTELDHVVVGVDTAVSRPGEVLAHV